jgi:hypothetical protein
VHARNAGEQTGVPPDPPWTNPDEQLQHTFAQAECVFAGGPRTPADPLIADANAIALKGPPMLASLK